MRGCKILMLHNRYQLDGGEDAVLQAESAMLAEGGFDVEVHEISNDAIATPRDKIRAALHAGHNPQSAAWMADLLERTGARLIHVHNFFPLLSPSIHIEAASRGVAVVQTLHNYRLLCAGGLFLRDGRVCEKCLGGGAHWGVLHRCYRGSLPGSMAVAQMQRRSIGSPEWRQSVHRFVALTEFARDKLVQGGLPPERTVIKPNFVADPGPAPADPGQRRGFLFVGRLSGEKGVELLVDAWKDLPDVPLTIVGSGPEEERLRALAPPHLHFTGALPRAEVMQHMRRAAFLVLPSIWYEGFPMTMVEALANGLPVVSSDIGALGDLVTDGEDGFIFPPGSRSGLIAAIRRASETGEDYGRYARAARRTYERLYRPETNLARLQQIYRDALLLSVADHSEQADSRSAAHAH